MDFIARALISYPANTIVMITSATHIHTPISIGVSVHIKGRRITIAGPDGQFWQFTGETVEPGYEEKSLFRKRSLKMSKN